MLIPFPIECAPFLQEGRILVLGLSGGRDSVALLHLLHAQGCRVYALHLHHGLRGSSADEDADFCHLLCERLSVPLRVVRRDVPRLAQEAGMSFEHMGRELRRQLFAELAEQIQLHEGLHQPPPIALAQHADDQAETVLFNLCRGAAGLRGIHACRVQAGMVYLRPLLHWRREQITQYLCERGLSWRDDETNEQLDATRNALRHQMIPQLSELMQRDVVPILARSARVQQQGASALAAALRLLPSRDPQGRLYLPFLREQEVDLQRAILFQYLREEEISDLCERVVDEAMSLLRGEARVVNLPAGCRLRRRQGRLFIERDQAGSFAD